MRAEQLMCGIMAAIFVRPWILGVTYFMMRPRPNRIFELIKNKVKANREIRTNTMKFFIGIGIVSITISKKVSCL